MFLGINLESIYLSRQHVRALMYIYIPNFGKRY